MTTYDLYALKLGAEALRLMRGNCDDVEMEMRRHAVSSDFDGVYRIALNPFQISFADFPAKDVREAEVSSDYDACRLCFEEWYSDLGENPAAVTRSGDGYLFSGADSAWQVWRTAWSIASRRIGAKDVGL